MTAYTVEQLIVPVSVSATFDEMIADAIARGLPATQWQENGNVRTMMWAWAATMARSNAAGVPVGINNLVALIARGGYTQFATGAWCDLLGASVYNEARQGATDGTATMSFTNASVTTYGAFASGTFRVTDSAGHVYVNESALTITASATTTAAFVAIVSGSAGSAATTGTLTTIVTPPGPGITATNTTNTPGIDAESDASYMARCLAKWGAVSPNGAAKAYDYVCRNATRPDGTSIGVTRTAVSTSAGTVTCLIAGVGVIGGGDVAYVQSAVDAQCTPVCTTSTVTAATAVTVNSAYNVRLASGSSLTNTQIANEIAALQYLYLAGAPIGGWTGIVPHSALESIGYNAVQLLDGAPPALVVLTSPGGNVSLTSSQIPVLGTVTVTLI